MRKNLIFIVTTLLAVLVLAACGSSDEGSTDKKEVFKVGLEAAYAPFNWTQKDDSNGAVKIEGSNEYAGGYDVEIAKRIADALGKELVIVKTDWDGLLPALDTKVIDAIIAGMSPTEKRKEAIDFSENYYTSEFVIVTKADSQYANATSLADFAGAKITSQLGTTNYDVIEQIPNVVKETAMNSFTEMRVALDSGVVDAYVAEKPEAISSTSANPKFVYVEVGDEFEVDESEVSVAVGLRKGDETVTKINEVLEKITEEERQELMQAAIQNQPSAE